MLKLNNLFLITAVTLAIPPAHAQNAEPTIDGDIAVARDAIVQLQDEMAKKLSATHLTIADYRQWSKEFNERLNVATDRFAANVETDVVKVLQPYANEYQQILHDPGLRDDQRTNFKASKLKQMQDIANGDVRKNYRKAYIGMLTDLMGWMPTIKTFKLKDEASEGIIIALDGKTAPMKFGFYNRYFENMVNDSAALYEIVDEGGAESEYKKYAGETDHIFETFVAPNISADCHSQACLSLKETDLKLIVDRLSTNIDKPFEIVFDDGGKVSVPRPDFNGWAYSILLSIPVVNYQLPFDTKEETK
jgi:hypothetical protein